MNYAEEEAGFEKVMDLIKAVRTLRADMGVHPGKTDVAHHRDGGQNAF